MSRYVVSEIQDDEFWKIYETKIIKEEEYRKLIKYAFKKKY